MFRNSLVLVLLPILAVGVAQGRAEVPPHRLPSLQIVAASSPTAMSETAVFSGGCFWGVQGVFSPVRGVTRTVPGYTGGQAFSAHYDMVATGLTGHAESVKVTYDPKVVSYSALLRVFFSVALDPTDVNFQGPDHGAQYRSVVWTTNPEQHREASAYIAQLDKVHAFGKAIATRVDPLHSFYPAEAEHQNFMALHPNYPYIVAYDQGKVVALKALYPDFYSSNPVGS